MQYDLAMVRGELANLKKDKSALEAQLAESAEQKSALEEQLANSKEAFGLLSHANDDLNAENARFRASLEKTEATVQKLEDECASLRTRLASVKTSNDLIAANNGELTDMNIALTRQIEELQQRADSSEVERLKELDSQQEMQNQELRDTCRDLRAQNSRLEQQLRALSNSSSSEPRGASAREVELQQEVDYFRQLSQLSAKRVEQLEARLAAQE